MAQQIELRNTDLVVISLALRGKGREGRDFDKVVSVGDLGLQAVRGGAAPQFDAAAYTRGITSQVPAEREAAQRLHAEFLAAVADHQVRNQAGTPGERLATGLVDWAIRTRPEGMSITRDPTGEGYVLNEKEFNIQFHSSQDGTRVWRVTAVATWGK